MQRTEKGRRNGTESAQRDKPLDGSRSEAPSYYNAVVVIDTICVLLLAAVVRTRYKCLVYVYKFSRRLLN